MYLSVTEKVAGELSDALTAAFDLGGEGNKGDDSYQFDDHFWNYHIHNKV